MEENVRRPNTREVTRALVSVLVEQIFDKNTDAGYEAIQEFLHGPIREAFLQRLSRYVNGTGEYASFDSAYGLLIKKII